MNRIKFGVLLIAAFGLMVPEPAIAQKRGGQKVGSSKVKPNQKTRAEVKKLLGQQIKKQNAKIQRLERRMNDFADSMAISPGLRRDPAALAVVHRTINEHGAAKKELNQMTKQSYTRFAASRGINMVPNPPRSAPPPLPQQLLPPRAKESLKQPKSKRPPGGSTR